MSSTIAATLLRNIDQFPSNIAATVFQAFSCFRHRKRHPGFSCPGRLDRLFGLIVFGSRIIARLIRRRVNGIPIGFCRRRLGRRCGCRGRCRSRRRRGRRCRLRCGCRCSTSVHGIKARRCRLLLARKHKRQDIVGILVGPLTGMTCRPIANGTVLEYLAKDRKKYGDESDQHQEQRERDATAGNNCLNTVGR